MEIGDNCFIGPCRNSKNVIIGKILESKVILLYVKM